jgi:hypothetical protein
MRLASCVMLLTCCLALPASGQQEDLKHAVQELINQSAQEHSAAMICSPPNSADYNKALNDWELRFGSTLRFLENDAGYNKEDILALRADFGPAAIFPSTLYTPAELASACQHNKILYKRFLNNDMLPLYTRIKRLVRQNVRN